MSFEFNNETPIYLQIIAYIKKQIISEKYLPNQKLPSVRELSFEFQVNPNTIQKALNELENLNLIYTERTNGKFVTGDEKVIHCVKEQVISEMINSFILSMNDIGINKNQIIEILNNKLKEN